MALVTALAIGLRIVGRPPRPESNRQSGAHNASIADLISKPGERSSADITRIVETSDRAEFVRHWRRLANHAQPEVRVAAHRRIGAFDDQRWLDALIAACSDADWRVRTAGYEGIDRRAPLLPRPLRDTPMDEREEILLTWLSKRLSASDREIGKRFCEASAGAMHLELGSTVTRRCLLCHAGDRNVQAPPEAMNRCADCHDVIHSEWIMSAHAQSLTHLGGIKTINPQTKQVETHDFGALRGINCTQCHTVAQDTAPRHDSKDECILTFAKPATEYESCIACHPNTAQQWQQWLDGPQPRLGKWPPGQIDAEHRGDTRTCVDCHMPKDQHKSDRMTHSWKARRDVRLLQSGIDLRVRPTGDPVQLEVVLTNLAGHANPTGTKRRALQLWARFNQTDHAQLIETLCDDTDADAKSGLSPALQSGEQRKIPIRLPEQSRSAVFQLVYRRNRFDPASYQVEITRSHWREENAR